MTDDAPRILDLSSLPFDQFVDFFFARAPVPDDQQYDYFMQDPSGQQFDEAVPSAPSVIVEHMTRLFTEFGQIAPKFSLAQLDQGVWGLLGCNLRLYEFLWDSSIPLDQRIQCIRSMYSVFADFVALSELKPNETGFYMWWDLILFSFWVEQTYERKLPSESYDLLDEDSRRLLDAAFETLVEILKLNNATTNSCALHGLGHLQHPGVRTVVQAYIDTQPPGLPPDTLKWLESCRDGKIM
ncbi:MAG: hypothetical protein WB780_05390 [Candidatus Acidiferrales bacterium]